MAKRIRPAMLRYAEILGAMKNGRPDWYHVAEELARIAVPELLQEDSPAGDGPGRPRANFDWLAMEVHRVMAAYDCGVRTACKKIALGRKADKLALPRTATRGAGWYTVGSPWKGENWGTLESRYWTWLAREKERVGPTPAPLPKPDIVAIRRLYEANPDLCPEMRKCFLDLEAWIEEKRNSKPAGSSAGARLKQNEAGKTETH